MKVLISGSRSIKDPRHTERALAQSGFQVEELVHGAAKNGVDTHVAPLAMRIHVPFKPFPAEWENFSLPIVVRKFRYDGTEYNAAAGMVRNKQMVDYVGWHGGLVAVWDYKSSGTANTIAQALIAGMKVFVYDVRTEMGKHLHQNTDTLKFAHLVLRNGYNSAYEQFIEERRNNK